MHVLLSKVVEELPKVEELEASDTEVGASFSSDGIATPFSAMVLASSATIPVTWRQRWSDCENFMARRGGREAEDLRRFVFRSLLAPMRQRGRCREGKEGGAERAWSEMEVPYGSAEAEREAQRWRGRGFCGTRYLGGFFLIYFVNF